MNTIDYWFDYSSFQLVLRLCMEIIYIKPDRYTPRNNADYGETIDFKPSYRRNN